MPRYIAFLRGVSPMNASMPALKACFESAGFSEVRTLLSSGNVAFSARTQALPALRRRAEAAMQQQLGHAFGTFVRSAASLQQLIEPDPYAAFTLPAGAKRVVTFLRELPGTPPALPITQDDARILACRGSEVLTCYVPGPRGPLFMGVLERHFGKDITTRTFDTVRKCATA